MSLLDKILGVPPKSELIKYLKHGAMLIDVRSEGEFLEDNVEGSINIPLEHIKKASLEFDKHDTYVLVCASGIRSKMAVGILKKLGFKKVYNGGSWSSFQ